MRTVGVILREGVTKGMSPSVSVLEAGRLNPKRTNEDLLPYLPRFRRRFTAVASNEAEIKLRVTLVPFSDIECLTGTICQEIDVNGVQSKDPEAMSRAKDQLLRAVSSWTSSTWQEADYSRVKDMNIRQLLEARTKAAQEAQEGEECIVCPELPKHVSEDDIAECCELKLIRCSLP